MHPTLTPAFYSVISLRIENPCSRCVAVRDAGPLWRIDAFDGGNPGVDEKRISSHVVSLKDILSMCISAVNTINTGGILYLGFYRKVVEHRHPSGQITLLKKPHLIKRIYVAYVKERR